MPSLGADMTEGTVVEWLIGPGDRVRKGDIVAVVDTTKSAIEVECFDSGVVDRLLVETGATVPVGTPLALISPAAAESGDTARPEPGAPTGGDREEPAGPTPEAPPSAPPETGRSGGTVAATPLVRHLAEEAGLDLASVHGTGPGGRITRADVQEEAAAQNAAGTATGQVPEEDTRIRATPLARRTAAQVGVDLAAIRGTGRGGAVRVTDVRAAAAKNVPAAEDRATDRRVPAVGHDEAGGGPEKATAEKAGQEPQTSGHGDAADRLAAMRRTTADLMARSKHEIPHYYLSTTVDLGNAVAWLQARNRELPVQKRLVTTAVLLKATALAARHVPQLNGFWTDEGFTGEPAVHLGVAVSLRGGGLVAPAIRDAADLPLPDLMARLREMVARARTGRLRASETSSATITVTNLGDQGVEAVFGVIYPPQVALVGIGKVVERPWAVNGLLGVRPVATVTLSADHRASDGATGARFLATLESWAQKPEEM